ncbi:MAG: ABC transporter permease [Limisphaerales bacterium]
MAEAESSKPVELVIEPGHVEREYWRDLWRYRELFYFLAWRDILVRYKQTAIGVAWAVIRPFVTVVVVTLVLNRIAKLESPGGVPYALFVCAAMLPWQFFAAALSESSNSLVSNANLIAKVYFPRLIVPAGSVITSLVDFLITLGMLGMLMLWHGFLPDWRVLALPLFLAVAFAAALGTGLWLCALNVKYRDFRYVVPFIVQFGLYISPVGFSSDKVPPYLRWLYDLNPMVGVIDGFRWACLKGAAPLDLGSQLCSLVVTAVLCGFGLWYFRRTEKTFSDVI